MQVKLKWLDAYVTFYPRESLRADLQNYTAPENDSREIVPDHVSDRLHAIYDRYSCLTQLESLKLDLNEAGVLHNVLEANLKEAGGSSWFVDSSVIAHLDDEVYSGADYQEGSEVAETLFAKLQRATLAQKMAIVEKLGF